MYRRQSEIHITLLNLDAIISGEVTVASGIQLGTQNQVTIKKKKTNLRFHREEHVSTWQFKSIWSLAEIARKSKVSELPTQTLTGMIDLPCEGRALELHPAPLYITC